MSLSNFNQGRQCRLKRIMLHLATLKFLNIIFSSYQRKLHTPLVDGCETQSSFSLPGFVIPEAKSSPHNCTQVYGYLNAQCVQPTDSKKPI